MILSTVKITFVAIQQNICKVFVKRKAAFPFVKDSLFVCRFLFVFSSAQSLFLITLETRMSHLLTSEFSNR